MWYTLCLLLLCVGDAFCNNSNEIQAAHCWYNTNCNGTIDASFNNETNCCKFGDFSYIKCTQTELQELLMIKLPTKKLSASCVRCPPKTPRKPNVAVCTAKTCTKPNERCVLAKDPKGNTKVFCLECDIFVEVCGNDKVSYPNECAMYRLSNRKGISVAYHGKCRANPTCASVKCKPKYKCVQKLSNGRRGHQGPRCVKQQVFCGVNNVTYASADDMRRASCNFGQSIYSLHDGPCFPNDTPVVVVVNATKRCQIPGTLLRSIMWGLRRRHSG